MNNLVPAGRTNFSELELVPVPREPTQNTSLERVFASIYRQRMLVATVFGAVLLLGLILTVLTPKRYTAVASVQLEQQVPRAIADPDLDPQPNVQDSERFLQTQLDRVRSRSLAETVEARLGATKSPAVQKALGVEGSDPAAVREQAIAMLQQGVTAQLGLNTRLAQITFTSFDPNVSARAANAFAEGLAASNVNSKIEAANQAKQYLQGQLAGAKQRLESSERKMLSYARSADLTTTVVPTGNADRGGSLRAQQLGMMTDALTQATARRIEAQQNWAQVSGSSPMVLPDVQNNRAVQDLVAQKAQLEAALQEDKQKHTDEYPSIRETSAKIAELNGQISGLASNIKSSFLGRYAAAAQQERQMAGAVGALRGAAMSERERSVGYNSLQREVETAKAFYDGLLQRYKEVAAASGAPGANVTVVDRATAPLVPSSPNVGRNLALASVAGLILALMLGSARERMHNVIRSADDFELNSNLPSLGVVPLTLKNEQAQLALVDPRSAQSEAYNSVAVALQQAAAGVLPKTLLITSSSANEGKSTSALGIARSLSNMGKRVLLVDADLRRTAATKWLQAGDGPGLSDALDGSATPEATVQVNEEHGFSLVSAGGASSNPVSLLAGQNIDQVLERLAADHDIVIIDGPPIMGLADAVLLARNVEAVLVVVESNRIHSNELDLAVSRLPEASVIGGVLTKFNPRAAGVRYGGTDYYQY
jgi:capsular exopolysaccharide synthesis family protein